VLLEWGAETSNPNPDPNPNPALPLTLTLTLPLTLTPTPTLTLTPTLTRWAEIARGDRAARPRDHHHTSFGAAARKYAHNRRALPLTAYCSLPPTHSSLLATYSYIWDRRAFRFVTAQAATSLDIEP
jgi:hypothetical protein